VNLDIGKLTGRDEQFKVPNIPPFYEVSMTQVAPRAPRAFIGPPAPPGSIKIRSNSQMKSGFKKSSNYTQSEIDSVDQAASTSAGFGGLTPAITPQEYAATKQMFKPRIKIRKAVAAAAEQKFFMLDDD
jgi:hypothetical protein